MKGRKPDPNRAKRATGHRPASTPARALALVGNGPEGLPDPPEPPEGLSEAQADLWRAILVDVDPRLLKAADLVGLRMLVEAADRHARLAEALAKYGDVVQGARGPMANPLLDKVDKAAATYVRLAEQYALTLQARMRTGLVMAQGASLVDQLRANIGERK